MKLLRKMTALVLSLSMVLSLAVTGVWVGADPADKWLNATLGELSKLYETGRVDDPGIIAEVEGDSGGKSYGTYMFASKAGTPHLFAHWCMEQGTGNFYYQFGEILDAAYHTGGDGCGAYFDAVWTQLATEYKSEFGNAQHDYVQDKFYNNLVTMVESSVQGFKIDNYSIALKNVFWSRAVQHGASGAYNVVYRALQTLGGFKNQSESALIEAIYAESSKLDTTAQSKTMSGVTAKKYGVDGRSMAYYSANSGDVQLGVYRRLAVNERSDALVMLQNNGYKGAALADGIYSLRPLNAQSLAIDYSNKTLLTLTDVVADGTAQKFSLVYHYGGFYTIETISTADSAVQRLTLDKEGKPALAPASSDVGQMWLLETKSSGYALKNKASGTYLMAPANNLVSEESAQSVAAASTDSVLSTTSSSVAKTAAAQKAVSFTLTSPPEGTYTVYGVAEGSEALTNVTASLSENILTLTSSGDDLAAGDYYVSVTTTTEDTTASESARIKLTVKAYEAPAAVEPTAWHFAPFSATIADWTMRGMIYPVESTVLHAKQSSFPVRGVISCSSPITAVNLTIENSTIAVDATISGTIYSYDLKQLDDKVLYSSLGKGDYTYVLTATTAGSVKTELLRSKFSVGEALTNAPVTGNDETFTVTFDANGGNITGGSSMTVSLDDIVYGELPTATRAGYKFLGWYDSTGTQFVPTTPVRAANVTLTAQYAKIYTYKFLNEDGTVHEDGTAAAGDLIPEPMTDPIKGPGYKFSGWQNFTAGRTVMGNDHMTFKPIFVPDSTGGSNDNTTDKPNNNGGGNTTGGGGGGGSSSGSDNTTKPSGSTWTLSLGTSISQMNSTVYSNGKVVTSGNLATGMTTTVDGKEYTISVKGDPSGDGKVSVTDVVKLQSHLLNKATLSGAYLKAADFNGDDKVTITDLVKAARVVAGKEKIG